MVCRGAGMMSLIGTSCTCALTLFFGSSVVHLMNQGARSISTRLLPYKSVLKWSSLPQHLLFLAISLPLQTTHKDWGWENLSCSIIYSYIIPQGHFLLAHCQLALWQLPTLWTQPFSRWLVLKPHASPMEPLILAVVVVAANHISERNFLTEAI